MTWKIEFDLKAIKDLKKVDKLEQKKIISYLKDRVSTLSEPRSRGKALIGSSHKGVWRYRVGDYRILCKIEDDTLTILVVSVGHRKKVYRQ